MTVRRAGVFGLLILLGLLLANLGKLRAQIIEISSASELERARLEHEKANLTRELAGSHQELKSVQSDLDGLRNAFTAAEAARAESGRESLRRFESISHLQSLGSALETRIATWENKLKESDAETRTLAADLQSVRGTLAGPRTDVDRLYQDLLHPSVQINARDAVGGGTMIHCRQEGPGDHAVHILTAYHVIQKSIASRGRTAQPIEARLYRENGSILGNFEATLVSYSETKDIALLRVRTPEPPTTLVRLAGRDFLRKIRIFTPVYAVGCPLGHDPIPSLGEISSLRKEVAGENFWMANAPTIFGNSGGGIFHGETHQMIGISAMICTYDNLVSTPVPHLSIVAPLSTVYDWLDEQGLTYLYEKAGR